MMKMDTQDLMYPQLLSEESLRQMLQERCIEVPTDIQSFDKEKLIEIYKRVAWPISQRKYDDKRPLGKRMNHLRLSRNIATVNYNENEQFSTAATEPLNQDDSKKGENVNHKIENGRLKPAIHTNDSSQLLCKKIRLSNSNQKSPEIEEQNEQKRKSNAPMQTEPKKRQKITWP